MNLIMRAPKSQAAIISRRQFFGALNATPRGTIIDPDFDNDNDEPVTTELIDWHTSRHYPAYATSD